MSFRSWLKKNKFLVYFEVLEHSLDILHAWTKVWNGHHAEPFRISRTDKIFIKISVPCMLSLNMGTNKYLKTISFYLAPHVMFLYQGNQIHSRWLRTNSNSLYQISAMDAYLFLTSIVRWIGYVFLSFYRVLKFCLIKKK